ncbi:MAG: Gfo/Idh/MocA family oxidoreductase [Lentisphaeria bacterium]|nr:Gfo/Idh/MocA family oxidoreductase [Lentisphaeria bacterium]
MRIGFRGELRDEAAIRVGFIGCGSHSFRNIYPTFPFCPVRLEAVCDLDRAKAEAFAGTFGAGRVYADHRHMLADGDLDAVFIVTNYDALGRPRFPLLALDCLAAGCHVWMEKPPAASCREIEEMQAAARSAGRNVMVGLKKMFFPANEKAAELMGRPEFGQAHLLLLQYPQSIPTVADLERYRAGRERVPAAVSFLDHLCHPASLMVYLLGMPRTLCYERSPRGAGNATFTFPSGAVCAMALTGGAPRNGGMEHTTIVGEGGHRIVVENNIRVCFHRDPPAGPGQGYGNTPSFYTGAPGQTAALWEPEFSLGQLYNKGLFLLGYWGEVNEFARSILEGRPPAKGTLEQAWQVTRIFEAFAEGPGKTVPLETEGKWGTRSESGADGSRRLG